MSIWPPADPSAYFASPEFATKIQVMTRRLVRLFPTQRTLAEEVVYDALANIFLGEAKEPKESTKRWRSEDVREWLERFPTVGHFDAYLFRAAYRGVIRGIRKRLDLHERPLLSEPRDRRPPVATEHSERAEIEERNAFVERVSVAIPGDEREVLHLLVDGVPIAKIAKHLNVSERTVYRIRSDLREILWKVKKEREGS